MSGEIERAVNDIAASRQPKFNDPLSVYLSLYTWYSNARKTIPTVPAFSADTRARDKVLSTIWQNEPHIAGILSNVVQIDKNRGWSLVGGRNQVRRFSDSLHASDNGAGWRPFASKQSLSFYVTDLGPIGEIGRQTTELITVDPNATIDDLIALNDRWGAIPMGALYHVDPTLCYLSGNPYMPLVYAPDGKPEQKWLPSFYFRSVSMPSHLDSMLGAGTCALSRALQFTELMLYVIAHDLEQLRDAPSAGWMFIKGINQEQIDAKLEEDKEKAENDGTVNVRRLIQLASTGDVGGQLLSFSQLPQGFELGDWVQILMQGYALCFGYNVGEFYALRGGSMGVGTQEKVQSEHASSKGELDFALELQGNIQKLLPDTLTFEIDERDDAGDKVRAEVLKTDAERLTSIYQAGIVQGQQPFTRDEFRRILVAQGQVDPDLLDNMTELDNAEATDTAQLRKHYRDSMTVRRSAETLAQRGMWSEPIIRLRSDGTEVVLWKSASDILTRHYPGFTTRELHFEDGDVQITSEDVAAALEEAERVDPDLAALLSAGSS